MRARASASQAWGIGATRPCGLDQRVHNDGALVAAVGAGKQP